MSQKGLSLLCPKAMFAREHRSRERYNCCVAEDAAMSVGSFFKEES